MHCHVELNTVFGNLDIVYIIYFLYLTQYVLVKKNEDFKWFYNYSYKYNTYSSDSL